jgi:hypothetical protein
MPCSASARHPEVLLLSRGRFPEGPRSSTDPPCSLTLFSACSQHTGSPYFVWCVCRPLAIGAFQFSAPQHTAPPPLQVPFRVLLVSRVPTAHRITTRQHRGWIPPAGSGTRARAPHPSLRALRVLPLPGGGLHVCPIQLCVPSGCVQRTGCSACGLGYPHQFWWASQHMYIARSWLSVPGELRRFPNQMRSPSSPHVDSGRGIAPAICARISAVCVCAWGGLCAVLGPFLLYRGLRLSLLFIDLSAHEQPTETQAPPHSPTRCCTCPSPTSGPRSAAAEEPRAAEPAGPAILR